MTTVRFAACGLVAAGLIVPSITSAESRAAASPSAQPALQGAQGTDAPKARDEASAEVMRATRDAGWRRATGAHGECDGPTRAGPYVLAAPAAGLNPTPAQPRPPSWL
ncbi:MAG: hypothetical protein OHK0044_06990 [Burkholderiaceae bacterium]